MTSSDGDSAELFALEPRVFAFAVQVMEMLAEVLPSGDLGFITTVRKLKGGGAVISMTSADPLGLRLDVDDAEALRLIATYRLVVSPISRFMTVLSSSFKVNVKDSNQPLFTVDYFRDSHSGVPAAHINFHAERDDLTTALLKVGARKRGKLHLKNAAAGREPRLGDLHFPLGGHRFRPCLEDVLEMLIVEFGVDSRPTATKALQAGRTRWREHQLAAAISDDPATAVKELNRLGYELVPRPGVVLLPRPDRLTAI